MLPEKWWSCICSPGKGNKASTCQELNQHQDDSEEVLKKIGNWIIDVANSGDSTTKKNLLSNLTNSLTAYWKNDHKDSSEETVNLPSKFLINTILKFEGADKLKEKQNYKLNPDDSFNYGETLGNFLLKNKYIIKENKEMLTNPKSLTEYYEAFPKVITKFFDGFISVLLNYHFDIAQKRRNCPSMGIRSTKNKKQNPTHLIQITTFLTSIVLTIAFRRTKFWLTSTLASLCRRRQLLGDLQSVLHAVYITAHKEAQERRLELKRMQQADPRTRLITNEKVWNLGVIDNIDFKQDTFKYGNIYDYS